MIIGVLTLDLHVTEANSLKSKRMVVKSLTARIRQKFNVSVAEVDSNELWQRSVLGISMVANETQIINKVFEKIKNLVNEVHSVEMLGSKMELL
jgi:uncharacterized protein YlxP (DUF503 family)